MDNPPKVVIVSTSQYSVPPKYTVPVTKPSENARRPRTDGTRVNATTSGVSASQAHAGWPNFGKLSASSAPDRMASA